jgi:hypothetical protein
MLTALSDAVGGFVLDTLTPRTLVSHYSPDGKPLAKAAGLLHDLGKRPKIIIKDLGIILSTRKLREEVLAQLRGVYDGEYGRPTGLGTSDDLARWKGRATVFAGMTPVIDVFDAMSNQLSERLATRDPRSHAPTHRPA